MDRGQVERGWLGQFSEMLGNGNLAMSRQVGISECGSQFPEIPCIRPHKSKGHGCFPCPLVLAIAVLVFGVDRYLIVVGLRSGSVRIRSQIRQQLEKLRSLADEKSVVSESGGRAHRGARGLGWANNRTDWEASVQEWAWLWHDQVGLQCLRLVEMEIDKRHV